MTDLLGPAALARIPCLDAEAISGALNAHLTGARSLGFELWGLAVLVAWHQRRIERRPPAQAEHPLVERRFPLLAR